MKKDLSEKYYSLFETFFFTEAYSIILRIKQALNIKWKMPRWGNCALILFKVLLLRLDTFILKFLILFIIILFMV